MNVKVFLIVACAWLLLNAKIAQGMASDELLQTGRITGEVVDTDTGDKLPGANVFIESTTIGAVTDLDGRFLIARAPVGTLNLVVSYVGYRSTTITVEVVDGEELEVSIGLEYEVLEGEEVVITAQVEGQIAAINQQLSSNTITNVVSGDRIEELPDVNAAESIGRLPGVSIQRSGGEANKVAIRGLSPRYNTVTVNGVRVPSTGADDRSVDLSLISSNMLDGIEVMKAITADKDADAIGGAIDLKLKEAPEGFELDVQASGGYNELQDYYGNYKVSVSASNRFLNNNLGLIVGVSTDEFDRTSDQFSGTYRQEGAGEEARALIQRIDLRESDQIRGRTGGSFVVDYKIPFGRVIGNGFYNQLTGDQLIRSNNFDLEAQRHLYSVAENDGTTSIATYGVGVEQTFSLFSYDMGYARTNSDRKSPDNLYADFMEEAAYNTDILDLEPDPITIPSAFFNDLDNTFFLGYNINDQRSKENEQSFLMNVKVPFTYGNSIGGYFKTGLKFRHLDRWNDENQVGRGLYYGGDQNARNVLAEAIPELGIEVGARRIPLESLLDTYTRVNFLDGDYPLGYTVQTGLAREVSQALEEIALEGQGASRRRDYNGEETYRAGYVMAEVNLGKKVTIIPGIRWEDEESTYEGQFVREVGAGQTPLAIDTTNTRKSTFALPMMHLQVKPLDWLSVRLAYTQTLSRPDFLQYAPITFVNQFGNYVIAGNPELEPAKSTNYDLSVSIYENRIGLFTVSLFSKSIANLIVRTEFPFLDGQEILPELALPNLSGVPIIATSVNNPFDAEVQGIELDWQTNFWYLPNVFKGVVFGVNYTRITSELEVPRYLIEREAIPQPPFFLNTIKDTSRVGRLPDQPEHIANVTLGYDFKGFSARVSMLYQTNVTSFFGNTAIDDRFTDDYLRWDLSVKQNLPAGAQIFANFNNVTARPDRDFRAELGTLPSFIEYYGFTMDVGIRFRY